jgi:hypothetical protein
MKLLPIFFSLALIFALASVFMTTRALATVTTTGIFGANTYSNHMCYSTPGTPIPSPCGCPTAVLYDICAAVKPPQGTSTITLYWCTGFSGFNCTDNAFGCGGVVYLCNFRCDSGSVPGSGANCTITDKTDYCDNSYGCYNS